MLDYLETIATESARFASLLRDRPADCRIPSCPDWSMADLGWHLTEVQHFWASIVEGLLATPESVPSLVRPEDAGLASLFDAQSARLVAALHTRNPDDRCWSWYEPGNNVGWVRRRQAHEALIHRVDAELTTGTRSSIEEELAVDGVDEILTTMLNADRLPEWSRFDRDGTTAAIVTPERSWTMSLGRFTGTSPNTGTRYDDPAVLLGSIGSNPSITISGTGADVDLWLWGRGPADALRLAGDRALVEMIRKAAAAATQ